MFSTKLVSLVAAAAAFPGAFAVHVIFGGTIPVVRKRIDPIVTPGVVSLRFCCTRMWPDALL